MLVLLPPGTVPLLVAAGMVLAQTLGPAAPPRPVERLLFAIPDGWHAVGPAVVLLLAGAPQLDLATSRCWARRSSPAASSTPSPPRCARRRRVARRPRSSSRCSCSCGWWTPAWFRSASCAEDAASGLAAGAHVLPLAALLFLLARERHKRIEQAQHRLQVAVRERSRLQSAVRRMGDAFAAKLDLDALLEIMLRGSIEAVDAEAGCLALGDREPRRLPEDSPTELGLALGIVGDAARAAGASQQIETRGIWALAVPFTVDGPGGAERRRLPSPAGRAASRTTRPSC